MKLTCVVLCSALLFLCGETLAIDQRKYMEEEAFLRSIEESLQKASVEKEDVNQAEEIETILSEQNAATISSSTSSSATTSTTSATTTPAATTTQHKDIEQRGSALYGSVDAFLRQFAIFELSGGGNESIPSSSAALSHLQQIIKSERFSGVVIGMFSHSKTLSDYMTSEFLKSGLFEDTLLHEFLYSEEFRGAVLEAFMQLQSEQSQMHISHLASTVLKKFASSPALREFLLSQFVKDEKFAMNTLTEWAQNEQLQKVLLQVFSHSSTFINQSKELLITSNNFSLAIAHYFLRSEEFTSVLIQEFAKLEQFLHILLHLFSSSSEFRDTLLSYLTDDLAFRDAVLEETLSTLKPDNESSRFDVVLLLELAQWKEFKDAVFLQFARSPLFQSVTLQLLAGVSEFRYALVEEFSQCEEVVSKIGESQPVVSAAQELFGQSETFRNDVMWHFSGPEDY